ncbi:hypothetical protein DSM25558_4360 [Agrobacterium sp. DSM 25558]|uniref:PP2C family serine/threonine-protein phosphatase n=1 Tax=Agrobacterium sp. DSM 25558 TaxID=1907665 RepID=UPI0009725F1C|nr:PP2C family serine/threonine-protein phosphatase [Agrobacterium sp. DSM 25558]SCX28063.1 hypothetical protein DSM25558_4360 [Agrobacterium sp. DSM 25558]
MSRWVFGAASVRGVSHVRRDTRIQDAKRCFETRKSTGTTVFCAVVSDGAGSASHGGEGASLVCRTMAENLREYFASAELALPTQNRVWDWVDEARDRIAMAATRRMLTPRDFAATMVLAVTNGSETFTAHIGDGAIVGRHVQNQEWQLLSASENGEYASTTYFLTDPGEPKLRTSTVKESIDALFLFSDGIENQVLDAVSGQPYVNFFTPMARPFINSDLVGRNHQLSERLAAYLDSDKFAEHTDDDKTLIIAVRK